MLREALPEYAAKLPTRALPAWMAGIVAMFDRSLRANRTYLGVTRRYDGTSGEALLGRPLTPTRDALLATARSLVERELI